MSVTVCGYTAVWELRTSKETRIILDIFSQIDVGSKSLVNKRSESNREIIGDSHDTCGCIEMEAV